MSEQGPAGMAERAWRQRTGRPPDLESAWRGSLEASGAALDLGPELVALSAEVASLAPENVRRGVHLLALAVLAELERGSTQVPLAPDIERIRALAPPDATGSAALEAARRVLEDPDLGGPATASWASTRRAPLRIAESFLAGERFAHLEERLAAQVRARVGAREASEAETMFRTLAAESDTAARLTEEQTSAVIHAAQARLTVITGGPGTGKTSVVVVLLELLARLGVDVARDVALAAPTGKATNRLLASVRERLPPELVPAAETLHRLLGARPGRPFARGRDNPVPVRFLVVDEASMLDLELADRLLEALEADTRLVLLGDADQLPSVEAGAVLRDLVGSLGPAEIHRLTQSFRMDPRDPAGRAVLMAARALRAGDAAAFFETVDPSPAAPVRFSSLEGPEATEAWLKSRFRAGPAGDPLHRARTRKVRRLVEGRFLPADAAELDAVRARLASTQLLTVTRRRELPHGAEAVNARLHRAFAELEDLRETDPFLPGEPVMMRVNDYERKLFNGDVGLIARVAVDESPARPMAVFPAQEGLTAYDLAALGPQLELAHAMTVHKAQGSEHDGVQLLLPARDVPILGPEVLYTAATRARRAVEIAGDLDRFRAALQARGPRRSGLPELLAPGEKT